jgi:hypothetical protein
LPTGVLIFFGVLVGLVWTFLATEARLRVTSDGAPTSGSLRATARRVVGRWRTSDVQADVHAASDRRLAARLMRCLIVWAAIGIVPSLLVGRGIDTLLPWMPSVSVAAAVVAGGAIGFLVAVAIVRGIAELESRPVRYTLTILTLIMLGWIATQIATALERP